MSRASLAAEEASGAVALIILVCVVPVWWGGASLGAQVAAGALSGIALLLTGLRSAALPRAAFALFFVLGVMLLQSVPVPAAIHALSPRTRSVFEVSLQPLSLYPATRPLSLEPFSTLRDLAGAATATAAFLAAWHIGGTRRRRELSLLAIPLAGVAVASVVLILAGLGAGTLLAPTAPFVNPNHLASLMNLAALACLGLAVRASGPKTLLWLLGFLLTAVIGLLSLSRGGIAAFVGGLSLFALLTRPSAQKDIRPQPSSRLVVPVAIAAALGLVAWMAVGPVTRELATLADIGATEKLANWRLAFAMIGDFPLFGVGRGAFEAAFSAYQVDTPQVTWTHLENDWLQPIVELGLPAGIVLLGGVSSAWASAAIRPSLSGADAGLVAGVAAVAIQNVADFSLEIGGVGIPFMVALGLAMRGRAGLQVGRSTVLATAAALCLFGAAGMAAWFQHPPRADAEAVTTEMDPDRAVEAARRSLARHPSDWLPHAVAGIRLAEAGRCRDAMPWLTRAMLLRPWAADPHRFAARCLADSGQHAQARIEFRLAISLGSASSFNDAVRRYSALDELLQIVPVTPSGLLMLGKYLLLNRPADAAVVFERAWAEFSEGQALAPWARSLLLLGQPLLALDVARRRTNQSPGDLAAWRVASDSLNSLGRSDEAVEEARRGLAACPGSLLLVEFLVDRSLELRRYAEADELAAGISARTPEELAAKGLLRARVLASQHRYVAALDHARDAVKAMPGALGPLLELSGYAELAGDYDEAIVQLRLAASLPGQDEARYRARFNRLEAKSRTLTHELRKLRILGTTTQPHAQ